MLQTFCTDLGFIPVKFFFHNVFLLIKQKIHTPLKSGLRFSTKAFTPSFASSDANIFR